MDGARVPYLLIDIVTGFRVKEAFDGRQQSTHRGRMITSCIFMYSHSLNRKRKLFTVIPFLPLPKTSESERIHASCLRYPTSENRIFPHTACSRSYYPTASPISYLHLVQEPNHHVLLSHSTNDPPRLPRPGRSQTRSPSLPSDIGRRLQSLHRKPTRAR